MIIFQQRAYNGCFVDLNKQFNNDRNFSSILLTTKIGINNNMSTNWREILDLYSIPQCKFISVANILSIYLQSATAVGPVADPMAQAIIIYLFTSKELQQCVQ